MNNAVNKKDSASAENGRNFVINPGSDLSESVLDYLIFTNRKFDKINLSKSALYGIEFVECEFNYVDFSKTLFKGVRFEKCKFNVANFESSKFEQCVVKDTNICASTMEDAEFYTSSIEFCNVASSYLGKTRFYNTTIVNTDFIQSNFSQSRFYRSFLTSLVVSETKLIGTELYLSRLNEVHFEDCDMSTAILPIDSNGNYVDVNPNWKNLNFIINLLTQALPGLRESDPELLEGAYKLIGKLMLSPEAQRIGSPVGFVLDCAEGPVAAWVMRVLRPFSSVSNPIIIY